MKAFFKRIWLELKNNFFTFVSLIFGVYGLTVLSHRADYAVPAIILAIIAVLRKENKTLYLVALILPITLLLVRHIPLTDFDTYGLSMSLDNISNSLDDIASALRR